ncbi:hypothetical protein AAVH_11165 [Aphelenchoides avenae]|nr:hypothetical protein AAVH_11165 [Aphelenchus avenae]
MIDDGELGEGELVVDENYEPDSADAVAQIEGEAATNKKKKLKYGVEFPVDGKCTFCKPARPVSRNNWARHLKSLHPEELKAAQDAESSQPTQVGKQTKLNVTVTSVPAKPNRLLALYAATSTLPLVHVENRYFQALLKLVPQIKLPDRRMLGKQIDAELGQLQATIRKYLADSKYRYSFALDISTTKGMTISLLGITAHVFAANGVSVKTFALEMAELVERHTGAYVLQVFKDVLTKMKLSDRRTLRVVTDCGSNMLKAFYQPFRLMDDTPDPDADEIVFVDADHEEMEAIEADEADEEQREEVADSFGAIHHWHIKCVIHRLETVLRNSFKADETMKGLRKRVLKVLGRFARSHVLSKELFDHSRETTGTGLRPLFPATTRWDSVNITYSRVRTLRPSLTAVCYANGLDEISPADYRLIDAVLQLTDPFRGFTKKLQQQSVPTISLVYVGIIGLITRMEALSREAALKDIAKDIVNRLKKGFDDVVYSGVNGKDPIYITSACLDPAVVQASNVLEENLVVAKSAIKEMARVVLDGMSVDVPEVEEVSACSVESLFGFEVAKKKPRLIAEGSSPDKLSVEFEEYRAMLRRPIALSTCEFWNRNESKLTLLCTIARNVLSVPASSAAVENLNLFSQMTLHSSGHKGRSKVQAIRRKSIMCFNEQYIKI